MNAEVTVKCNGERIEYHPNVIIDIVYFDEDRSYTFDVYHGGQWHYGYTRFDQAHQIALKALEQLNGST